MPGATDQLHLQATQDIARAINGLLVGVNNAALTRAAHFVLAGPTTGAAALPTWRALVWSDLPSPFDSLIVTGGVTCATPANAAENSTLMPTTAWVNTAILNAASTLGYIAYTADHVVSAATDYIVDCTTNAFTVTLPTAVGIAGRTFYVKNSNTVASGKNITMATTSSQTIDGTTPPLVPPLTSMLVASNGANWIIL